MSKHCTNCDHALLASDRFCTRCGKPAFGPPSTSDTQFGNKVETETMSLPALYLMVAGLILAGLFPPWESAPGQPPEFLGFHFIMNPPDTASPGQGSAGVVSRLLITIELVTIAIAGFYFSWLFRKRDEDD